jgi:hypothetical protein
MATHDFDAATSRIRKSLTRSERELAKSIADVIAQTAELVANDYRIWDGADALRDFAKRLRKINAKTLG